MSNDLDARTLQGAPQRQCPACSYPFDAPDVMVERPDGVYHLACDPDMLRDIEAGLEDSEQGRTVSLDSVMRPAYTPPEGSAIDQVAEALAAAYGVPAGPLDDLDLWREQSTVMEQEARAEQAHLRPTHETKAPEQRIEW